MKDYSMSEEDKKFFVCRFKFDKKGNIIVSFPKFIKNIIPKNEKNEQILINKMEEQVRGSEDFMKKTKHTIRQARFSIIILSIVFGIFFNGAVRLGANEVIKRLIMKSLIIVTGGFNVMSFIRYLNSKILLKDLRKNRRFLAIKDTLNNNVRTNSNMIVNTSDKTKRVISQVPEDKEVFNINSFNDVPYRDLMQIMDNIERYKKFKFDYEETESTLKPKTRKKVR